MTGLSIIYISNRMDARFEWFYSSLKRQSEENKTVPIEIIYVDSCKRERDAMFCDGLKKKCVQHIAPLPSAVQGPHRLTHIDWWSASAARNTGFIHAKFDYIVFADDLSVLMPGWLDAVIQAATENYVVLGTYEKRNDVVVEDGLLISSTAIEGGMDSRIPQVSKVRTRVRGNWLFGCSFGMPTEFALEVNGFDEICNCIGAEDTQFGDRLLRVCPSMYFDTRMKTVESGELHFVHRNFYKRAAFLCTKERYFEMLNRYGIDARPEREIATYDAAWFMLDLLKYLPNVTASMLNPYSIKALRAKVMQGYEITVGDVNLPEYFFWTDQKFADM